MTVRHAQERPDQCGITPEIAIQRFWKVPETKPAPCLSENADRRRIAGSRLTLASKATPRRRCLLARTALEPTWRLSLSRFWIAG
jgi:hypothetical protein